MLDRIKSYIDRAFAAAPQTRKVQELKEELFANLCDKYEDLVRGGMSQEEAYNEVIRGIGDIDELVESVKEPSPLSQPSAKERSRSALLKAVAVMLYILSPFVMILFAAMASQPIIGLFAMFLMVAVATGMLIYNHSLRGSYQRADDSVVEEFKEFRVKNSRQQEAFRSFKTAFWGITTAVYLLISFYFGSWAFSWILFIIAAAIENIVKGVMQWRADDHEE